MHITTDPILVDTRGTKIPDPEICCEVAGRTWRFVIDESLKWRQRFHLGLFVDNAAYTPDVDQYPFDRRACALQETPIDPCHRDPDHLARRFPVVFTHQRNLLDRGAPFVPSMFGTNWVSVRNQQDTQRIRHEHPAKSKLVSFVGSLAHANDGAYAFRRVIATELQARGDVDCFGKGIHEIPAKPPAIGPYRFSVAMENTASDYYFSEKVVDCILLETVPIYYGCTGIAELLDPRGFLCFQTLSELTLILDRLTPALYDEMRPFVLANKARLVEARWHSHDGLFERTAEQLATMYRIEDLVPTARQSRVRQMWVRLVRKLR